MRDRAAMMMCLCLGTTAVACETGDDFDDDVAIDDAELEVTDEEVDGAADVGIDAALISADHASALLLSDRSFAFQGTFDATPERYDAGSVVVDPAGRITLVSSYSPPSSDRDALVTRMADDGTHMWTHRFGVAAVSERASAVTRASGGASVVVGSADGQPLRFMIGGSGHLLWSAQDFHPGGAESTAVIRHDGDYVMAGKAGMGDSQVPFATRFAEDGSLVWSHEYRDFTGLDSECEVSQIFDAGTVIYLVGTRRDLEDPGYSTPIASLFVLELDPASGKTTGMRLYPHVDPAAEQAVQAPTMVPIPGGYAVGYSVFVAGDGHRIAVATLDDDLSPLGELHYVSSLSVPGDRNELGLSLFDTPSGDLDLGVAYGDRPGLLRISPGGGVLMAKRYGPVAADVDHVEAAAKGPGGYVLHAHNQSKLGVAIVDDNGNGLCEDTLGTTVIGSGIGLEILPYESSDNLTSVSYPMAVTAEAIMGEASCW